VRGHDEIETPVAIQVAESHSTRPVLVVERLKLKDRRQFGGLAITIAGLA
jgi:hypothetical protein